jgi:hypothetical protein
LAGDLNEEEFREAREEAMEGLEDEEDRSGHASSGQLGESKKSSHHNSLLDEDLASLKRKFPWLADFFDTFIRGQSTEALLKMETTSMKMKMMECKQDFDEKLASNKMELAERVVKVLAGEDDSARR